MSTTHDLEKLMRAVGDATCLAAVATDLAESIDAGDHGRTHVLAAVLRALRAQSRTAFDLAESQWLAAHRAAAATPTTEQGA